MYIYICIDIVNIPNTWLEATLIAQEKQPRRILFQSLRKSKKADGIPPINHLPNGFNYTAA